MVYCGKNSKSSVARYACFKKGVGVGLRMTPKNTIKSRKKCIVVKNRKHPITMISPDHIINVYNVE